jgi:hypothetical protein
MAETLAAARKINNLEDIHCIRNAGFAGRSRPSGISTNSSHSLLLVFATSVLGLTPDRLTNPSVQAAA